MNSKMVILVLFQVLGGLSLFIYGMNAMTRGLRAAAGTSLRTILAKATRSRPQGFVFGTLVGFLAHSGAAITMLAGFINAGVMTLEQAIAPVFGGNLGTSLSMQLVSLNIADYCGLAIAIGVILRIAVPAARGKSLGNAFIGFGLLFLGMETIQAAIAPHRDIIAPVLEKLDTSSLAGRSIAIAFSAVVTAIITSSGAMMGLCFALVRADVFTDISQVAPYVFGSMIGTCIVPLTAALPMKIGAKRAALAHLLFNIFNVLLGLCMWPLVLQFCVWTSPDDLMRQTANCHTSMMLLGAALLLPLTKPFTRLLIRITPSKEPAPTPSFLEDSLLPTPERALAAVLKELRRMANLCIDSMYINGQLILTPEKRLMRQLSGNETTLDEICQSAEEYLRNITKRKLSQRQSRFLWYLDRCIKDLERIGDYLEHLGRTAIERFRHPDTIVAEDLFQLWFQTFCAAQHVLRLMAASFDPDTPSFRRTALSILQARDAYVEKMLHTRNVFSTAAQKKEISPRAAYYINHYLDNLDHLVRRAKSIAFAERQPIFWIKHQKYEKVVPVPPPVHSTAAPTPVNPAAYLAQLKDEAPSFWCDLDNAAESDIPDMSPHTPPPDEMPAP